MGHRNLRRIRLIFLLPFLFLFPFFFSAMADPQMLTAEGEAYLRDLINDRIGGMIVAGSMFHPAPQQARALSLRCCSMRRSTAEDSIGRI